MTKPRCSVSSSYDGSGAGNELLSKFIDADDKVGMRVRRVRDPTTRWMDSYRHRGATLY
jgi:hypothetical protein